MVCYKSIFLRVLCPWASASVSPKPNSGRQRETAEEVDTQETNRQMERLRDWDGEAVSEMTNTKDNAVVQRSR